MKKAFSIILISIALTNIVGFMPLYLSLLQEIKVEVNLKLATGAGLQKLKISDLEYNNPAIFSMCGENEFMFRGQIYDFSSMSKITGGYIFYALQDSKESNLIDFLKPFYGQSNQDSKSSKMPLANLLKNFSKDFVGSFSKKITSPLQPVSGYSILVPNGPCSGYFRLILHPPDVRVC